MNSLKDKLKSAPFIRVLIPFCIGILAGENCQSDWKWIFLWLCLASILILPFLLNANFKQKSFFGLVAFVAFFFFGLFTNTTLRYQPKPFANGQYYAIVDEYPLEREKSYRAILRLVDSDQRVLAYFGKSDTMPKLEPGTIVWFRGKPEVIQKTGNPFEFDYQTYALRNNLGYKLFIKPTDYHVLKVKSKPNLAEYSIVIRAQLIHILENCGLKGESLHLVSAVALGAREELEPETTQSFSKTGVTHVLAVSGMNVAIIYVVLEVLLRFLNRKRWGIFLQTLIILGAVWGYALITGLSASVLRAAVMFSFIVIGKSLNRNANIYNTLAASAFVLLCYHPALIYDVGFQLSYLAVLSIVYFHPYLYGLVYCKYWVIDQIWIMLTVSMAAQFGTLPFLLHYFHQFPTWFLLANLLVIPLVTLILYLSFIVFAIAPLFPILGIWLTRVLDLAGQGMLFSVRFVEHLPYSIIEGLYPSDSTMLLIIVVAIFTALFVITKKINNLRISLIVIIILVVIGAATQMRQLARHEVVVFNLPHRSLIAFTAARTTYWLSADSSIGSDKLKPYIKPYEGYRGILKSGIFNLSDTKFALSSSLSHLGDFINLSGFRIWIFRNQVMNEASWRRLPSADLIILTSKRKLDYGLMNRYCPNATVVDASLKQSPGKLQIADTEENQTRHFSTEHGGSVDIQFQVTSTGAPKDLKVGYFSSQ
jgi:competence protein ComEC